jgi:hypothetical protein
MRRIVEAILDLLRWSAVADAAVVLSAGFDGAALLLPVTRQRSAAELQPSPADGLARGPRRKNWHCIVAGEAGEATMKKSRLA